MIHNGYPIIGIVYAPALDRLFFGNVKDGSFEETKEKTSKLSLGKLKTANLVAVASESHRDNETNIWLLNHKIKKTVSIGSSLKFCLIAAGEADVYPRFSPTMEWDTAAGDAILRSAGGVVTTPNLSNFVYGKENYKNGPFIAWGRLRE